MWELHLRRILLKVLEKHRIWTGKELNRDEWLKLSSKKVWINFHHPILAVFNRDGFRRKVKKTIESCIPPHDDFQNLTREKKDHYYTTFTAYPDEKLQITQKGIRFIGFGGYVQQLHEKYPGIWILIAWIIGLILLLVNIIISAISLLLQIK